MKYDPHPCVIKHSYYKMSCLRNCEAISDVIRYLRTYDIGTFKRDFEWQSWLAAVRWDLGRHEAKQRN